MAVQRLGIGAVALAAVETLSAGGSGSGSSGDYRGLPDLGGVRTADGNHALVATYTAGPCDTLPRARVTETSTVATISAALPSDYVHGDGRWALTFPLPGVLGARLVRNGPDGPTTAPFDGAVLTDPTRPPTGHRQQSEEQIHDAATRTLTVQWDTRSGTRTGGVTAVRTGATPTLTVTELLAVADTLPSRG